jgi:peptidoglycan/LPS O-acetylase OafA/YrhL
MVQLDGLRAAAIAAVLIDHWSNGAMIRILPLGLLGVRLFFVISGFLITGILLRTRAEAEAGKHSKAYGWRHFYIRRALRIFPIYYLTVAICAVFGPQSVRDSVGWHLLYASNFYVAKLGAWPPLVGHFWSLAIEEQFYLVWPWLILFFPRKLLPWTMGFIVLLAPAYRLIALRLGFNQLAVFVATPSAFDSLGLGAILALCDYQPSLKRAKLRWVNPVFGAAIVCLMFLLLLQKMNVLDTARKVSWYFAASLIFFCVVDRAATGMRNVVGRVLGSSVLVWIGKVSYGVYMYHPLINALINRIAQPASHVSYAFAAGTIAAKAVATFAAAALSWYLIESPLLGLKRHFTY